LGHDLLILRVRSTLEGEGEAGAAKLAERTSARTRKSQAKRKGPVFRPALILGDLVGY